jgi:hypothetical protein
MTIRFAVDTLAYLGFGTASIFNRFSLLHDDNLLFTSFFKHFKGSEDPRGTRADNYHVFLHNLFLPHPLFI